MSSRSNSWIREAWMAAPRAARSEGLMAVGEVDGERTVVEEGKADFRREAILGVCDVPPARIICQMLATVTVHNFRRTHLVDV